MSKKKDNAAEILEQLFEDGYATKEVELIPNKLTIVLKNLNTREQIEIEQEMAEIKGSGPYVVHTYGLKLVGATLVRYGVNEFSDRAKANEFITNANLSSVLIDKIVKSQNLFEKEVRLALNMEEIDKVFFAQASPPKELTPSQKESILESEAVSEKQ